MKYRYSIYVFLILFFACSKDFLDRQPLVGVTEENFYQTEGDAIAAVNAAYAALQFELSPAGHFRWFWGDIVSDDANKGGSGDNDVFDLLLLETFQGRTNSDLLESEWAANYDGIYRANVVLEKVPDIDMDPILRSRILGEARFIRAWFHFLQVTVFGNVPIVDKVLAPSEFNQPQAEPEETWAFIERDLIQAIEVLPLKSEYPLSELGRITKGAAQALLAKAYLFQNKFSEAEQTAAEVINSGEYMLVPDYASIFTQEGENNAESIFEIQYMNASGGNWGRNNANEGTFTNVFQRARGQFGGFGFNIPTQDLVDEFFKEGFEDPRLSSTVFREGEPMGDRGIFTKEATGGFPHDYYPKKYFNNLSEEAPFGDPAPNGGSNDRVIRYSDLLLMHAEAAYHTGNISAAQGSLNQVRARVSLSPIISSGPELLEAIYRERRIELGLEGHRFFDLVRTGRAQDVLGPLGYQEGVHNIFPIPLTQIQLSNGVLRQNPGY